MKLSYHDILSNSITPFLKEGRAIDLVKELSRLYTINRDQLSRFDWSDEHVSAYSLFYLATNVPKLTFLLKTLELDDLNEISNSDIIDIGCGPGTYLFSLLSFLSEKNIEFKSRFIGVDNNPKMLKQADSLSKGLFPKHENSFLFVKDIDQSLSLGEGRGKVLIFGNSLNEISSEKRKNFLKKSEAKYIFIIEPGTTREFNQLLPIRDYLIQELDYDITYPCPSQGLCPMIGSENWCHQVLRMSHDPSIERFSQLLSLDRKTMPFIGHIYKKGRSLDDKSSPHFVQFLTETKYSFEWEVCMNELGQNKLFLFEIPKKVHSKEMLKTLKKLSVGCKFSYTELKKINENKYRVKIESVL